MKLLFLQWYRRRYHSIVRYVASNDGLIARKGFTEDLFAIEDFEIAVSADGRRIKILTRIHSFTDFKLSDRRRISRKRKIRYCKRMSIAPVAVYRVEVSFEMNPYTGEWGVSLEVARAYRDEPEKIVERFEVSSMAPGALRENAESQY
ncbi:MAG: hypothetical protein IJL92_07030 [Thermoguttaceae bacterium]|nr:hypothetical protein [Thermoguttaceae bacterium]